MCLQSISSSHISTATRIPYADHIVALDDTGEVAEQGTFGELNAAGGYVSRFNLPQPDWTSNTKSSHDLVEYRSNATRNDKSPAEELGAEASRQTGDVRVYVYYARSVGWLPVLIFVVAIVGFVFCYSFPSTCFHD